MTASMDSTLKVGTGHGDRTHLFVMFFLSCKLWDFSFIGLEYGYDKENTVYQNCGL